VCDLGEGFAPAWHPSRDLVACQRASRTGGPWTTVIIDVATGHSTDLWPESGRGAISPSWTADGRWVLLASVVERDQHTGFDGLWAISLEGARRVRLTQGGVEEWCPREGPDGRIVYARREGETVDLWSFASPLRK
ncbi:MAG: hypothetical protein K8T20_05040, partial [Planctomycetes bacterium]|nr:hypothetical protein [Planctomycetota bacterium]